MSFDGQRINQTAHILWATKCYFSLNKLSFRGPGGVGRRVDSQDGPKSVRGNWHLWSPVASRGLPPPPTTTNAHLPSPPPTTTHHQCYILSRSSMMNERTYQIKYQFIYIMRQTTAMNKIPQSRQQWQQRCPIQPSRYCGILFIAVVCLMLYILFDFRLNILSINHSTLLLYFYL